MLSLPDELLCLILDFLSPHNTRQLAYVCKRWHQVIMAKYQARNHRMYEFIMNEALLKFCPTSWTMAGSAALWLLMFVQGKAIYWEPNDVDMFYLGLFDNFTDDNGQWLDTAAQPSDVIPFNMAHDDNYTSNRYITRSIANGRHMRIHVSFAPFAVYLNHVRFDIPFLNITARFEDNHLIFWFDGEVYEVDMANFISSARIHKYKERFSLPLEQMMIEQRRWQGVDTLAIGRAELPPFNT